MPLRSKIRVLVAAATALVLTGGAAPAIARPAAAAVQISATPGESTAIPGFAIQSSGRTSDTGGTISQPGYAASGWYPVSAHSTVLAGLLQNNVYADPFYSTNMKSIPTADFTVPWWYRADFTLGSETGLHTFADVTGVLSKADVWINGTQVATSATIAGAYTDHELDLTAVVHSGVNSLAVKVYPNDPNRDLTMGWIDWVQTPPDKNMGIVRDVKLRRSGAVAVRNAHVVTRLSTPALDSAVLTAKADVRNDSAAAVTATVSGTVAGTALSQSVSLAAHETKTVTFGPVTLTGPQVWWPAGMGGQPLYDLSLTASVAGGASDAAHERFGVRDVKAPLDASGHRRYTINGRPLQIRGGGWSPDLFLRWNPGYVEDKLRYVLDLGLNTVRLEGHIEADEFFDLTDRLGILTLPGWECCDKWEGQVNGDETGEPWTAADYPIAKASMAAEAARLRDHPSVISFLIGSDFAPDATIEQGYLDALNAADWSTPVIAAASDNSSPRSGPSGMKMTGPYDWIPPNYWYDKAHSDSGGAWGFNGETSAGPDVPTMDTLKRMMSANELNTLWQSPNAAQYHRSPSSTFSTLKIFDNAITGRYGTATSLDDYVRKAQLAQYENVRAQFESYRRNFTDTSNPADGVIYWMLNSGWTSLHWQLFDYYLDQNGAYYGAKKANEPLHVQWSYDNRSVVVVNQRHAAASGLTAKVNLYNPDGTQVFAQTAAALTVPGDGGRATALTVPSSISGIATTYLAKLVLLDSSGVEVSRNVYWLSTAPDTVDWANNDWYYAPTSSYANLKGLAGMASAPVSVSASSSAAGGTTTTTVTLRNTSTGKTPAFYVDAHVLGAAGRPVLPIQWDDNEISLWPGESKTLTAKYRTADLAGAAPSVRVSGWNVATQTVPAGGPDNQPVRYEAENATISQGSATNNHSGYSGTGFVDYANVTGGYVQWSVTAAAAGTATLTYRIANGTTVNRPMNIAVNATVVAPGVAFDPTADWDTWRDVTVTVPVTAGTNTIRATATTPNGGPNVDYLDVR
ncbi:glycosyl hydrolase 2 galactose-binding domain-containing protein [Dactylosporangium sp. NPDC051541]|uniref:glycosyl hydrolase 2 galactose-binding domain-containing protein n=1 Tax=Dactylosporangium sp. NPDC051541 TaxID=3363977 RepID=UPI003795BB51